jgi:hypothetical protein
MDVNDVEVITTRLAKFEFNCNRGTFNEVFGQWQGDHLWDKFNKLNRSILALWGVLDDDNRKTLSNYLYLIYR